MEIATTTAAEREALRLADAADAVTHAEQRLVDLALNIETVSRAHKALARAQFELDRLAPVIAQIEAAEKAVAEARSQLERTRLDLEYTSLVPSLPEELSFFKRLNELQLEAGMVLEPEFTSTAQRERFKKSIHHWGQEITAAVERALSAAQRSNRVTLNRVLELLWAREVDHQRFYAPDAPI